MKTDFNNIIKHIKEPSYYPETLTVTSNFILYKANAIDLMKFIPDNSIDLIFADPPYFLSNDGITCHAGKA